MADRNKTLAPPSTASTHESATSTAAHSHEQSVDEKTDGPVEHDEPEAQEDIQNTQEHAREDVDDAAVEPQDEKDGGIVRTMSTVSTEVEEYPGTVKLILVTVGLCLSVFCMALDNTIIATAIPRITDHFHALNDVGWYGSAYLLTVCAFQLIYGKLYTFYSIKYVYLVSLTIFEIGSLICGVAPSSTALIVGRAVAGLGAAGIFTGALLILSKTVPLERRPIFMGMIGGMYGIASVAGPLMGGAFTDRLTWRWCFYINLPFGAVTIFFILFFLPALKQRIKEMTFKEQLMQFDIIGTVVFIPAVVCLLLSLQWGGSTYPWKDGRIIALLVLCVVLGITFVVIQIWKQETATVPPRIFKNRNIWGAAWFAVCVSSAFFVFCFYIPIWFQAIKGVSAVKSGIMNLPMVLSLVILSIISGGLVTTIGYYTPFILASVVVMSIGAGLLTTFHVDTGHAHWIGYQVIFGMGVGMGMQQTLIVVQAVLDPKDIAVGTAILMFSQMLGGSLFVSVGQNVFQNQLLKNLHRVVPEFPATVVLNTGATEVQNVVPAQYISRVLVAYNEALTQTWYVAVAMACLSVVGASVLDWKSLKGKKIDPTAAA